MDITGARMEGGDENDVVFVNSKQTNKHLIMVGRSCKKDSLESFVVGETDKCTHEGKEAKIETYKLKGIDRGTDKKLSAALNADKRINKQNDADGRKSDESKFK